jgi:catechol 2,3-dioxygenase-like lactoylglutathione lyase family enzyme
MLCAKPEEAPMAKIRHIAISSQDPDATAKFYVDVFGLKQVGRIDNPNTSGYYLTDGDINVAILKFKNDKVAGVERGKDWSGIHHFGFQVDDLEDTTERLAAANAPRRDDINEALGVGGHHAAGEKRYGNVEVKYTGPDGVTVDVSETGWIGTQGFRPE